MRKNRKSKFQIFGIIQFLNQLGVACRDTRKCIKSAHPISTLSPSHPCRYDKSGPPIVITAIIVITQHIDYFPRRGGGFLQYTLIEILQLLFRQQNFQFKCCQQCILTVEFLCIIIIRKTKMFFFLSVQYPTKIDIM